MPHYLSEIPDHVVYKIYGYNMAPIYTQNAMPVASNSRMFCQRFYAPCFVVIIVVIIRTARPRIPFYFLNIFQGIYLSSMSCLLDHQLVPSTCCASLLCLFVVSIRRVYLPCLLAVSTCCPQFVQRQSCAYMSGKENTVWSMDRLNDYINLQVAPHKNLEHDWVFNGLTVGIRETDAVVMVERTLIHLKHIHVDRKFWLCKTCDAYSR